MWEFALRAKVNPSQSFNPAPGNVCLNPQVLAPCAKTELPGETLCCPWITLGVGDCWILKKYQSCFADCLVMPKAALTRSLMRLDNFGYRDCDFFVISVCQVRRREITYLY